MCVCVSGWMADVGPPPCLSVCLSVWLTFFGAGLGAAFLAGAAAFLAGAGAFLAGAAALGAGAGAAARREERAAGAGAAAAAASTSLAAGLGARELLRGEIVLGVGLGAVIKRGAGKGIRVE